MLPVEDFDLRGAVSSFAGRTGSTLRMNVCMRACVHACMHACMHVCMDVRMYCVNNVMYNVRYVGVTNTPNQAPNQP